MTERKSFGEKLKRIEYFQLFDGILIGYCLSAPISIAISQVFLFSLIAIWIWGRRAGRVHPVPLIQSWFLAPIIAWVVVYAVATFSAIDLSRSLADFVKSGIYLLVPFAIAEGIVAQKKDRETQIVRYAAALCAGQGLAAIDTVISALLGRELAIGTPGPVTESGQIAMVLPLFLALFLVHGTHKRLRMILVCMAATLFLVAAWPHLLPQISQQLLHTSAGVFAAGLCALVVFRKDEHLFARMLSFGLILFVVAFAWNLKRGPWAGAAITVLLLGACCNRRLFISTLLVIVCALAAFGPIRNRLGNYAEDFSIAGGRKTMWSLGLELAERYPLGVGPRNAVFMQTLDPSLPAGHRHLHNNLLNVLVEFGWLGLAVYLWWMWRIVQIVVVTWKESRNADAQSFRIIFLGASLGLLAWQLAGVVEYNFGDGEIRMIAFFLMGMVLSSADGLAERVRSIAVTPASLEPTSVVPRLSADLRS